MTADVEGLERRREAAHRATVTMEVTGVVAYLQEVLGQRLVAHVAGVKDVKTVGKWVTGQTPQAKAEERLRAAFQVFQLLQEAESPHVVRAWFVGMNPQLDDEAPATALRDGRLREVLTAAQAFLAGS